MRYDENQILKLIEECGDVPYEDLISIGITPDVLERLKMSVSRIEFLKRQKKAKSGLLNFTLYTTPEFSVNWHHKLICDTLDEFLDFNSGLDRLVIQLPPRTSKSELASRKLPAYAFGKYPDLQVIATSYSADLASRMNRDVQRVIDSNAYREIFPEVTLSGKNIAKTSLGSYVRTSDMFEIVGRKGAYRSAGIGGGITGMGADIALCLPYDQTIMTNQGPIQIGKIVNERLPVKILSFNHDTMSLEFKNIIAYEKNPPRDICRIITKNLRKLSLTEDHPVYVKGIGYVNAVNVKSGDVILCLDKDNRIVLDIVRVVTHHVYTEENTYNVRVEDNRNYFANQILVHNCDDPFKDWKDANSPTVVKSVIEWFDSVLSTRLSKRGKILIIQTRWSEKDLAGHAIEQTLKNNGGDQYRILSLPMIFDSDHPFNHPLDPRVDGELLWPDFFPESRILKLKKSISKPVFSALYQQSPAPTEGNIIQKSDIGRYIELPKIENVYLSLDSNFKEASDSDFVVIGVWGVTGKYKYLLDIYREQIGFTKTKNKLKEMIKKYRRISEVIIEAKANGEAIIDDLKNDPEITVPLHPFSPTDSKASRLNSVLPEFENKFIFVPDTTHERYIHLNDIIDKYITELVTFPKARNDDCVDMTTQFLLRLRESNFAWLDYAESDEYANSDDFQDLAERMGWVQRGMGLGF